MIKTSNLRIPFKTLVQLCTKTFPSPPNIPYLDAYTQTRITRPVAENAMKSQRNEQVKKRTALIFPPETWQTPNLCYPNSSHPKIFTFLRMS